MFRNTLKDKFDQKKTEAGIDEKDGWAHGVKTKNIIVKEKKEIYPGIIEMLATLNYEDVFSKTVDNKKINMITTIMELDIDFVLVKSGEFYYPYDVFPAIKEIKK
jgi:hypothetical protein